MSWITGNYAFAIKLSNYNSIS